MERLSQGDTETRIDIYRYLESSLIDTRQLSRAIHGGLFDLILKQFSLCDPSTAYLDPLLGCIRRGIRSPIVSNRLCDKSTVFCFLNLLSPEVSDIVKIRVIHILAELSVNHSEIVAELSATGIHAKISVLLRSEGKQALIDATLELLVNILHGQEVFENIEISHRLLNLLSSGQSSVALAKALIAVSNFEETTEHLSSSNIVELISARPRDDHFWLLLSNLSINVPLKIQIAESMIFVESMEDFVSIEESEILKLICQFWLSLTEYPKARQKLCCHTEIVGKLRSLCGSENQSLNRYTTTLLDSLFYMP
jgi:hypothetical protein